MPTTETARWEFHHVVDLVTGLEAAYQGLFFERQASGCADCNWDLEVRAADRETLVGWQRALLVTPWTVRRVYVPETPHAPLGLPEAADLPADEAGRVEEGAEVRLDAGRGPVDLEVAFDPRFGHHLVEDLLPGTSGLRDSDEALEWARAVAARRDGQEAEGDEAGAPRRQRLSRRQLFRSLLGRR
jgi:hypothetical protein